MHDPFHGVVVQRRLKDVQKSVMHVQSCCSKPIAFLPLSLLFTETLKDHTEDMLSVSQVKTQVDKIVPPQERIS